MNLLDARAAREHRLAFLRGFLRRPAEVGSVVPSSRFLEKRIVRIADPGSARVVVELGPGTGGTTRALLREMAPDARLLAIEINAHFVRLIERTIDDPRLIVHHGSAVDLAGALAAHGLAAPELVLSGIPFSTMPRALGLEIVRGVRECLADGGRFVAYQFRDRVGALGRQVFGPAQVQLELLNVPPMRIYRWEKTAAPANEARG